MQHYLPEWMSHFELLGLSLAQWVGLAGVLLAAAVLGVVLQTILLAIGRFFARRTSTLWDEEFLAILPGYARVFLTLLFVYLLLPVLDLGGEALAFFDLLLAILLIITLTLFGLRFITFAARFLERYLTRNITEEYRLRSVQTQIAVPRAILRFLVVFVGVALVLLQFDVVRSIGVSLLASAGIAGIVIGFAAQRTIANLFAGIQLTIFQPIRIGDAVIVENEFGRVEEIGLTHVVVKIWDLRRLVLPVTYFLERPFQNWTRISSDLMGTVFLYVDYSVAVDEIRARVQEVLAQTDLWDGKVQVVHVTNMTDRHVEVRVLVSALDSGKLFDLRCLVREKLLGWLQERGREHLPLLRVQFQPDASAAPAS